MNYNDFIKTSCERIDQKNFLTLLEFDEDKQLASLRSICGMSFYQQCIEATQRMQMALIKNKIVVFLSDISLDLLITHSAALMIGNQVAILDSKLTSFELDQILLDLKPDFLFVEDSKWIQAQSFYVIENHESNLINLNHFSSIPFAITPVSEIKYSESQIIVYTSGTSGRPKGVILGIDSIIFEVQSLHQHFFSCYTDRKAFSILPVNHMFGLILFLASMWNNQEIIMTQSLAPVNIRFILQELKPNCMCVVPQFLALIKNSIMNNIEKKPPLLKHFVFLLFFINKYLKSDFIAKKFFGEIRKNLGAEIDFFVSGGASLPEDIFDFFEALRMPAFSGYGLTETAPVISLCSPKYQRRKSVGKAIPGVKVRIDPKTLEIQVNGPNIFRGYYNHPEATKEMFTDDHWFKTGDLGHIDHEGYIFINGRSKNMIVLPDGKKIQPEEVESFFLRLPELKACCLVYGGENGKIKKLFLFVEFHAALFLSEEALREYAKDLAQIKRPQSYIISENPLPLTATLKVKRFLLQNQVDQRA